MGHGDSQGLGRDIAAAWIKIVYDSEIHAIDSVCGDVPSSLGSDAKCV